MPLEDSIALFVVIFTFLGLLSIRLHVGLSLMLSGFIGIALIRSQGAAISTITNSPFSASYSYSLIIIPLFILMGILAVRSGLAQAGFDISSRVLRKLPGGPALSSLAGSGLFAAVTGSSIATVATLAKVSTTAILNAGLSLRLAAGVVCAGGTLGVLIPPSIVLVLYGVVTDESIGKLLLAGIGPGILTIIAYVITVVALVYFSKGNETEANDKTGNEPAGVVNPPHQELDVAGGFYLCIIFMVSIGSIYLGIATPTEAASFGAITALIIFILRSKAGMLLSDLRRSLDEAVGLTSMTFLLIAGAGVFTYFLSLSGTTTYLVSMVTSLEINPYLVLVLCLLILLPLGMFLDGVSMILIAAPVLHQILTGYGFDGIWLAVVVVKVAEMALITPPVGMNAFVYSGTVKEASISTAFRGIIPFIVADFVVVAVLIAIPSIVTYLPNISGVK
ncbi:TRAP transporter large permease [Aidingimonas lacisalsi]|uniref:TRAP transporter large permease n=1 Tax=Aidingimonas lacisalsi TaxID=2604086 RepID=UPI0011D1BF10|nr:TRAP transporter large permease [Aidingimonas lacisalsi]